MDNTSLMLQLLRQLKVEMNGEVSATMNERGIRYGLNYGVTLPTIQRIAREYTPCHSLALFLYQQDVRELKLAASWIDRPEWVTREQMELWSRGFINTELIEVVVMHLFAHSPLAMEVAREWITSDRPLIPYAGLLLGARAIPLCSEENLDSEMEQLLSSVDRFLEEGDSSADTTHAIIILLRNAAKSSAFKPAVLNRIAVYKDSEDRWKRRIAEELSWQVE